MASPTPTRIQQLVDDVDRTVYNTATYTPTANRLLIAFIVGRHATAAADPTGVTGNGLTWSKKGNVTPAATVSMSVWVVDSGASPTNAAMAVTFAGAHIGCLVAIYEVANTDRSGTALAAIIQTPVLKPGAAALLGSITLAAPASGLNRLLVAFTHGANEATTPRTAFPPWTEDYDTGVAGLATPVGALEVQKLDTTDLTASASWVTSSICAGIAVEIAAALKVTTNMTRVVDASATAQFAALGGGSAGLTLQTDFFIQGINCVSKAITGAGTLKGMWTDLGAGGLDFSDAGAHANKHIYVWVFNGAPSSCDLKANGGVQIILGNSDGTVTPTNYAAFYVDGSDTMLVGGWRRYVIDPTKTPSLQNGNFSPTTIRYIGVMFKTTQAIAGQNLGVDAIDYGLGLLASGVSTDLWGDILAADMGSQYFRWGLVQEVGGVLTVRGQITVGDNVGTRVTDVSDVSKVILFENPTYDQSGIKNSLRSTHLKLLVVGNATGTTKFQDGVIVGSGDTARGRSGSLYRSLGGTVTADFSAANVTNVKFYGTSFSGLAGGISFSTSAGTAHDFVGTVVDRCGQVSQGNINVRNVTYSGTVDASSDGSALLWNDSIDIKNSNFIANTDVTNDPHGIKHVLAKEYTYTGLKFSGNDYDVQNSAPTFSPAVTLAEDIDVGETVWTVNDGSGVTAGDFGLVGTEYVNVTGKSGNDLTVERAKLGSTEATHSSGAAFTRVLVINLSSGSDAATAEDLSTSVTKLFATIAHTLTDMFENSEVTYVKVSDGSVLFNVENVSGTGETTFSYGSDLNGVNVDILVFHIGYLPIIINLNLPASDASIPVSQVFDHVYANP